MENNSGIIVYTDGGCRGNPGCGGWGCVIIDGEKEYKFSGGEKLTTNNRMELMAAISALNSIAKNELWKNQHIAVYSDSQYVKNGITSWLEGWKRKNWRTSSGGAVKNKDLWIRLDEAYSKHDVTFVWVKGHNGHPENERCDELARTAASGNNRLCDEGFHP